MLRSIVIKNLALISSAELNFGSGLNVLSGETGAGKSIIVDAIMLLLGGKYDKSLLRYGETSGFVEGIFDVPPSVKPDFCEMGYEIDDEVIVTRKFFEDRSEIRLNGRLVTAAMIKKLTERLVDIYGQHEYISLSKPGEQSRLFDYYIRSAISDDLNSLAAAVTELKAINNKLSEIGDAGDRERLIDILKFQLGEIEKAAVKKGEEEELSSRRKLIASKEKIFASLSGALNDLSENEVCAEGLIEDAANSLSSISHIDERYSSLLDRLNGVENELSDICESMRDELSGDFDPSDLDRIERRLDVIKNIRKKYGDYDQMTEFFKQSSERLYTLNNSDKIFASLNSDKQRKIDEIYSLSLKISNIRRKKAKEFEREIERHLSELGMKSVRFEVQFNKFPSREECEKFITEKGMDAPEFYFSPNVGQPLKPMTKIISGGEMSRFMLALKVVNGERDEMPTMIFDEIDVGISGETGRTVACKLQDIARDHQVLCVTHLPQIAAMASEQFYIEKSVVGDKTVTKATRLDRDGMIKEIARLSGALGVSENAEKSASELKQWCDEYKSSPVK